MGSQTGWILAVALVIAVVLIGYFALFEPPPSGPRETQVPGFMELTTISVPMADAIGRREPEGPGNAADDYQKAVQLWLANAEIIDNTADHTTYDALVAADDPWADPALNACREIAEHVARGAQKREMRYTFVYTPKTLRIGWHHKHADHLWKVAVAVHQLHMIHRDRQEYPQAEKLLQDQYVLSWHMLNERALPHVETTGLEIMESAIERLIQLYERWPGGPKQRVQVLRQVEDEHRRIALNFRKKKRILWDNIPASDPVTHQPLIAPGDIFNMAQNEADRAWRVQAHIALGPLKHLVSSRGDVKKTAELIIRGKMSDDPLIKAASQAADALDAERFRKLGQDFGDYE